MPNTRWSWDQAVEDCLRCNENVRVAQRDNSPLPPGFYGFFDEPSPVEYKMIHRMKHEKYLEDKAWRKAHPIRRVFRKPYDPNRIFWRKG